jgi:hypothetical protein
MCGRKNVGSRFFAEHKLIDRCWPSSKIKTPYADPDRSAGCAESGRRYQERYGVIGLTARTARVAGTYIAFEERIHVDIQDILAQLRQEASRIENAIAALAGLGSRPARRGRPPKVSHAKQAAGRKRRRMSPAARKRISAAMKQRWAQQKRKSAPKKAASSAKKSIGRRMSPAMRKKMSALMKARWAARKKAGAKAL